MFDDDLSHGYTPGVSSLELFKDLRKIMDVMVHKTCCLKAPAAGLQKVCWGVFLCQTQSGFTMLHEKKVKGINISQQ